MAKTLEAHDKLIREIFEGSYGFLAAILSYGHPTWEKLSIFLNFLIPKLPAPKEEDLSKGGRQVAGQRRARGLGWNAGDVSGGHWQWCRSDGAGHLQERHPSLVLALCEAPRPVRSGR